MYQASYDNKVYWTVSSHVVEATLCGAKYPEALKRGLEHGVVVVENDNGIIYFRRDTDG